MFMGYRSAPHTATEYSPFEALIRRNIRTKLEHEVPTVSKDYNRMEKEITFQAKQYKMKRDKHHIHTKCEEHHFKVDDKVLLKKRKVNRWSTAHEHDIYEKIEIYGSIITARRKSHMIRPSVDLRVPNKYMERNRILQAPVVKDFTCKSHDCKVFSEMDLTN